MNKVAVVIYMIIGIITSGQVLSAVKLHTLGDSTTEWGPANQCYRYHLWNKLQAEGYAGRVDMVGSMSGPDDGGAWDRDHDGHTGSAAHQVLNGGLAYGHQGSIREWAPRFKPDYAIIHLGTNDLRGGENPAQTVRELGDIINVLRTSRPDVTILLCKIIPATTYSQTAQTQLNALIGKMDTMSTAISRVIIVDMNTGYNPSTDNRDGLHPGATGSRKMADRAFAALKPFLDGGTTPVISANNFAVKNGADKQVVLRMGSSHGFMSCHFTLNGARVNNGNGPAALLIQPSK